MGVDIYTTNRLVQRWCKDRCDYKGPDLCAPQFFSQGVLGLCLDIRVIGKMLMSECPIACRIYPNPNHMPVAGSGDCGYTPPENPME